MQKKKMLEKEKKKKIVNPVLAKVTYELLVDRLRHCPKKLSMKASGANGAKVVYVDIERQNEKFKATIRYSNGREKTYEECYYDIIRFVAEELGSNIKPEEQWKIEYINCVE